MRRSPALLLVAGLSVTGGFLSAGSALADPAPSTVATNARPPGAPVRGVVQKLDGTRLLVDLKDGTTATLILTPTTVLTAQRKAAFSDIKPHDFVASAGMLGSDGKIHAQEVRIFPESMRGVGEGHTPMALPNQTMTNATVSRVDNPASMTNATVTSTAGGVLTTVYPGGSTDLVVDPGTPVWAVMIVDRKRLTPGTPVLAFGGRADDGSITARFVSVQ